MSSFKIGPAARWAGVGLLGGLALAAARRGLHRSAGEKKLKRFQRLRTRNPAGDSRPGRK